MSGGIEIGKSNGNINISGGNSQSIETSGNSSQLVLESSTPTINGTGLTSYQRAVMAGYIGTEGEFYTEMAERMMGNSPVNDAASGIKVVGQKALLTLGDGSRNTLTA